MEKTEANLVIAWFIDLEDRLKTFLRTVPINWNHRAVLPLLSGIITEAGGLVDSILRKEYDLSESKAQRHNLRINHFRDHYEKRYSLSSSRTLVYQHPPVLLSPFMEWSLPTEIKRELEWWNAYNKIKHERIENYAKCTLSNAVLSMCAFHQLLSVLPCFFRSLISHDMVRLRGYAIRYAVDCVEQGTDVDLPFLVESLLFATPWGQKRFPDDLNNISGAIYGGSMRLEQFVGK